MEVTSAPNNVMTGSKWDSLSQQIWSKFISNQQTEATYRNKMMLWKHLYIYIKVNIKRLIANIAKIFKNREFEIYSILMNLLICFKC